MDDEFDDKKPLLDDDEIDNEIDNEIKSEEDEYADEEDEY
jgi:hypothetical protein